MKRDSSCPLCGAKMTSMELLDACTGVADADLGVLAAQCPHCQGLLEIRPAADRIDIGYCVGTTTMRFETAISLPYPGLVVSRSHEGSGIVLSAPDGRWSFSG